MECDIGKLTPKNKEEPGRQRKGLEAEVNKNKEEPGRQRKGLEAEVNRSINIDHEKCWIGRNTS